MSEAMNQQDQLRTIRLDKRQVSLLRRSLFVLQRRIQEKKDQRETVTVEELGRLDELLALTLV